MLVLTCTYGIFQVMPGLLLSFVLRFDKHKRQTATHVSEESKIKYFHCSLIGYFVGKNVMECFFTPEHVVFTYKHVIFAHRHVVFTPDHVISIHKHAIFTNEHVVCT